MANLFIAPLGAMQFEVERGGDGTPIDPPIGIWVTAPITQDNRHCKGKCALAFGVIEDSIPDGWWKDILEETRRRKKHIYTPSVCFCMGRIIE